MLAVGLSFVIAIACDVGIGADDSDAPDGFRERQQMAIILEQRHRLAC